MKKYKPDTLAMLFGIGFGLLFSFAIRALVFFIVYACAEKPDVHDPNVELRFEFMVIYSTVVLALCVALSGLWERVESFLQHQIPPTTSLPPLGTTIFRPALRDGAPHTNGTVTARPSEPEPDESEILGFRVPSFKEEPQAPLIVNPTLASRFPRVILAKGLLDAIHDYISDFIEKRGPNLEIGGMLVGEFEPASNTTPPIVRLRGFVDAGPKANCQPASILMDAEYQGRMLQALQLQHPNADVQGMFHLHPGIYDECSSGDYEADCHALTAAGTGILVFIIVTRNNPKEDLLSLRVGALKLDFFIMSRHLGPRYHKVLPIVEEAPLLKPEPLLARWTDIKGQQARADWLLLRQTPGIASVSLREIADKEQGGLWLTAATRDYKRNIHVLVYQDGALRLFLGKKRALEQECLGPWTQPDTGSHIFASQLVLLALEHLRTAAVSPGMGRHFASFIEDKQRLVAEMRAMRERFGDEPQLHRKGNQLLWTCVARQNGREFPIEIYYPPTYPYEPPEIRSLIKLKEGCPHFLNGQMLCWIDSYGSHSQWNPGRDTAATALVAIHRWFSAYLIWLTLGHWPESAEH